MSAQPIPSVLIVEDDRIIAKDIEHILTELGYDAFAIAASAEEAIARASERCPDLVLMDIRIKGSRDGIQTAELLKGRFAVPVVYLTAHADEATLARAKKTEPHGYLLKPVTSAELRIVVETSLYKYRMEKRLRKRERWFSTMLQSIADAVIAVDLAGNVTFMNDAAERLTGTKLTLANGKPVLEILQLVDLPAGEEHPALKALHEGRLVDLQEGILLNITSGARSPVMESAAPVVDEGKTVGAIMVIRDVTDQKHMQKQLEMADRLASLGTMAAAVAHEVNNPLAVVAANSVFLAEELKVLSSDPGMLRSFEGINRALQDLQSAASRIGVIISDLRAFTRPAVQVADSSDVNRCVAWAIKTTAAEFRHRAQVVTRLEAVPAVVADEARLGQVLVNLLVNAAQAIEPGAVDRKEVVITTQTVPDGRVSIEVRDPGRGIPEDVKKRIFEPFFTTKAVGEGTGLGLSICHGIVRSLGGEILVESEVGIGTAVQVLLPALDPTEGPPAPSPLRAAQAQRGRILVIDDETLILRTMGRILRDHEVTCVESAREALALIDQGERFDVILSDLMMPVMTGIEFYENLLSRHPDLAKRVVFLSGGAITVQVEDFLRAVRNRRVDKPFDISGLRDTVQQVMDEAAATLLIAQ